MAEPLLIAGTKNQSPVWFCWLWPQSLSLEKSEPEPKESVFGQGQGCSVVSHHEIHCLAMDNLLEFSANPGVAFLGKGVPCNRMSIWVDDYIAIMDDRRIEFHMKRQGEETGNTSANNPDTKGLLSWRLGPP